MTVFYFIGTIHSDIDGAERLEKLLQYIKPDAISIEANDQKVLLAEEKRQQSKLIITNPVDLINCLKAARNNGFDLDTYKRLHLPDDIGYFFEYFVPKLKWKSKGVDIHLVDPRPPGSFIGDIVDGIPHIDIEDGKAYESFQQRKILTVSPDEARKIIHQEYSINDLMSGVSNIYQFFEDRLRGKLSDTDFQEFQNTDVVGIIRRNITKNLMDSDEGVERKLRRLSPNYERFVHIAGNGHIFQTYPDRERNLYERMEDIHPIKFKLSDADKLPVVVSQ